MINSTETPQSPCCSAAHPKLRPRCSKINKMANVPWGSTSYPIPGGSMCVCDSLSCRSQCSFRACVNRFVGSVFAVHIKSNLFTYFNGTFKPLTVWTVNAGARWHFRLLVPPLIWSMQASCSGLSGRVHASQLGRSAADLPQTGPGDRTLSLDIFHVTHTSRQRCQELLLVGRTW